MPEKHPAYTKLEETPRVKRGVRGAALLTAALALSSCSLIDSARQDPGLQTPTTAAAEQTTTVATPIETTIPSVAVTTETTMTPATQAPETTQATTTLPTTTTEPPITVNTMSNQEKYNALSRMSPEECAKLDVYDFLSPLKQPRVLEDGSTFHYNCKQNVGLWQFPSDAKWEYAAPPAWFDGRDAGIQVDLVDTGLPADAHNLGFEDAASINQLKRQIGNNVCVYDQTGGTQHTYKLERLQTRYLRLSSQEVTTAHSMAATEPSNPWRYKTFDLINAGVLPDTDGWYTRSHVELGSCPKTS